MTPAEFRRLALRLPDAAEGAHMGHADFRVGGRIFATLGYPNERSAALMLSPQDQDYLVRDHPGAFAPAAGKWGASGSTMVTLARESVTVVAAAIDAEWRRSAPNSAICARGRGESSAV